jgi:hypothetical protein
VQEIRTYLEEVRDLSCAPLLQLLVEEVSRLDPEVRCEIGAFGVRFAVGERPLCEFSVFGELFIARVGSQQAVEYRVRNHEVALEALDHVLRDYVDLCASRVRAHAESPLASGGGTPPLPDLAPRELPAVPEPPH